MIKLTDTNGNLFPAIRNLLNLIWLAVGIVLGWGGNIVWNRQAEADQLVSDAKAMLIINKETKADEDVLGENIKDAKQIKTDCGSATNVELMLQLRKNRVEGRDFDDGL